MNLQPELAAMEQEALALLEKLCQIPAPSGNEDKRVDFVFRYLKEAGAEGVYVDEAKNVVFPYHADGKSDLTVFLAHTDVVFPDLTPLPYKEENGRLYAPGIGDDTVCLVQMLLTVKHLLQNDVKPKTGLLFVANSCEEGLGNLKGIRQIVKDYDGRIGCVYALDCTYDEMITRCVGSHRYRVTVKTEGGHSFNAFGKPNAIAILSKLVSELYELDLPEKPNTKTTYNVGLVEGGTSINTIAQSASMLCEYRSDDLDCLSYMQESFASLVEAVKKRYTCSVFVEKLGDRPCAGNVDEAALAEMIARAKTICESRSGLPCAVQSGSTDCNVPQFYCIPAIAVGSYMGKGAHTREEYIEKDSVVIGLGIVTDLVLSYCE